MHTMIKIILGASLLLLLAGCSEKQEVPQPSGQLQTDKQVKLDTFSAPPSASPTPTIHLSPSPLLPSMSPSPSPTPTTSSLACSIYGPKGPECYCMEMQICVDNDYINHVTPGVVPIGHFCFLGRPYCEAPMVNGVQQTKGFDQYCYLETPGCNQRFEQGQCQLFCWAKPVIYLYPTMPSFVHVLLEIPGIITVSDPLYPATGWHVFAKPSGEITYNAKAYPYLYYETEVAPPILPSKGMVIKTESLTIDLLLLTRQLGLTSRESADFLDYWIPRLKEYDSPYWLVKLLDHEEKVKADKVVINPEPDTRIELLFHFTPLQYPVSVEPMRLPKEPPKRVGFTMVEWGGGIEQ